MSRIGNFEDAEYPEDDISTGDSSSDVKDAGDDNKKLEYKDDDISWDNDYSRPTHWRAGMRDQVWDNAKDENGEVHDPLTGRLMSKDEPWDMGHKPGYEFRKHQDSAAERGISRDQFLDEYYNPDHYQPELPSSNRSHKGENLTDEYFGD